MGILSINAATCSKCSICIKSCPALIIESGKDDQLPYVAAHKEKACIRCGHCEAICPNSALSNQLLEQALSSSNETNISLSSAQLSSYLKSRRSIRNYQSKTVDRAILEQVMEVVRFAPTGTNSQQNKWIVISGHENVQKLAAGTINWMRAVAKINPEMGGRYNFNALVGAYENGIDLICRNAPHIIIGYTPAAHRIGAMDTVIATSHIDLLLPSFGLGSCWAGFLNIALQNSPEFKKSIGLDETSTVQTSLMVGYPKFKYYKTPARKPADVKWVE